MKIPLKGDDESKAELEQSEASAFRRWPVTLVQTTRQVDGHDFH